MMEQVASSPEAVVVATTVAAMLGAFLGASGVNVFAPLLWVLAPFAWLVEWLFPGPTDDELRAKQDELAVLMAERDGYAL